MQFRKYRKGPFSMDVEYIPPSFMYLLTSVVCFIVIDSLAIINVPVYAASLVPC